MSTSPQTKLSHRDKVLAALIVKNSKLGETLVEDALAQYAAQPAGQAQDLAHFFVALGHFSRTEMYRLVKARNFALLRKEDRRIARRAVRKGYLLRTQILEALDFQKQLFKALGDIKRLHDILVEDGKLTQAQVNEIWAEYREYLKRRGERPEEARTDPSLLKRQG